MWIETTTNSKGTRYIYSERYQTLEGVNKKVSITFNSNTSHARKQAQRLLQEKINNILANEKETKKAYLYKVANEWQVFKDLTSKSTTISNRERRVRKLYRFINEYTLLGDITPIQIETFIHTVYYKEGLSYDYCKAILQTVKGIFRYAKRNRIIQDISDIECITLERKPQSHEDIRKRKNKFLERDELKDALTQLKALHPRIGLAMEFISRTGLRIGELLALREQDYNKSTHTININGTITQGIGINREPVRGTPKNIYSVRDVTLDTRAVQILEQFIFENKKSTLWEIGYKNKGYIFTANRGNPYDLHFIAKYLRKLCINDKHISTHVFRHTHISILAQLGVPIKAIMERVGHNDPNTTLTIYTHVTNQMQDEVLTKLNTYSI